MLLLIFRLAPVEDHGASPNLQGLRWHLLRTETLLLLLHLLVMVAWLLSQGRLASVLRI